MQPLSTDDMKQIELGIMDEIDAICRAHDLRYYLAYGSLLGAMRHGGFIPWDDDMDIVMPRKDYEKLLGNFDLWRHNDKYVVSSCRKGNSVHPFAKIVDSTTLVSERYLKPEHKTGVWVDIFPLDHIPRDIDRVFRKRDRLNFMRAISMSDPHDGATLLAKVAKRLLVPLAKNLDPAKIACQMDENAINCEKTADDAYMVIASSAADPTKVLPAGWFEPIEVEFENRKFFAPKHWEEYLTFIYGNWRSFPPESERRTHTTEAYRIDSADLPQ